MASLMLTSGTAGDRYGHRRVVLAGLVVFGAGSLLCGLAPGVAVLVAARVVQGVGAALLLPGTLAIIGRAFPGPAARARAAGVWAGMGSLALPAGLAVLPLFLPLAVFAPLGGRITSRIDACVPAAAGLLIAAAGLTLLIRAGPHSGLPVLLPAFLLWGSGCGLLTPAVVAAATGAVPEERGGLASAVNNTARQTGGAIGVAEAGAVAGQPEVQDRFLRGFHAVALGSAGLYAGAAMLVLFLLPGEWRDA
ncbi:MFS transporter [Streptomyces sasae]|uniref:MFS transporter n=1 Tax=Streptomyces sasae TaxID=1266772 RepID=UPI00292EFCC8|nr:MFS transporter [Streptomyces sasae]